MQVRLSAAQALQLPGNFSPGGPGVPVSMNNPEEQLL